MNWVSPVLTIILAGAALVSAWIAITNKASTSEAKTALAQAQQANEKSNSDLRVSVESLVGKLQLEIANLKTALADMRNDIGKDRGRDREELSRLISDNAEKQREWINGSFMRSKLVEAILETNKSELRALLVRVGHLEKKAEE